MLAHGRRVAASTFALVLAASTAHAVAPHEAGRGDDDGLIAMTPDKAPVRRAIRLEHRAMRPAAWTRFVDAAGGRWSASWDHATAVPSRIWGAGIAAPGASADPAIAADAARALITAHLDLLAPGADPGDLTLVSNDWDGEMRTVGFVQSRGGMRVLGGQVSVRIKHDRIFVISSQALPDVSFTQPRARLARGVLADRARDAIDHAVGLPATTRTGAPGPAAILPLIGDDGVLGYHVVAPLDVDAGGEGRWTAFVDPATGDVVARRQELSYVSAGDVRYDVVLRWTGTGRYNAPAAGHALTVNGTDLIASPTGGIIWGAAGSADVVTHVDGLHAAITDESGAPLAVGSIVVPRSGTGIWSVAGDEIADAQVNGAIHAGIVQEFARTHFAGGLPFLTEPVQVHVNINDRCNAYSNGTTINFFKSDPGSPERRPCGNTARIADVVYHEYGHSIHHHAIIEGVGAFDGGMSEGLSDFLAASITGDPGMGRGFFGTDDPLRDIDPVDREAIWPRDIGEVHVTGEIFGGTFWDLRKRMISELGEQAGVALTLKMFYASVQRATDIPSSLIESLAADDDDGNLENGTPHECAVRDVFGAHGMRTVSGAVSAPGSVVAAAGQTTVPVEIQITGLSSTCAGDEVERISLGWRPGVGATPASGVVDTTSIGGGTWTADLPLPDDGGRVDYQVVIKFLDGTFETLPDNPADQYYQLFQGETVPLYCTDFETDPFAEGWAIATASQFEQANFVWGEATAEHSATDPPTAYSGTRILALGLGYDYVDETTVSVRLPPIDVGQYSDVMLQYRRWLTVEDATYDHALIQVNGATAWTNLTSSEGSTHHLDREWRFHTVGLSTQFTGPTLDLSFRLDSDEGLHFGGWQLDDLCVVANPNSICGDGTRSPTEQCDEGPANGDQPDGCRATCKLAACGDGVLDTGEECEPGQDSACLPGCIFDEAAPGGCCSAGGDDAGAVWLLIGGVGLMILRRRRRR